VIAVVRQQVIVRTLEPLARLADDLFHLGVGEEGEALQDLGAECAAGGLEARACVVDARFVRLRVPAVGVLAGVYEDGGVEEGGAEEPEDGGEVAGLLEGFGVRGWKFCRYGCALLLAVGRRR